MLVHHPFESFDSVVQFCAKPPPIRRSSRSSRRSTAPRVTHRSSRRSSAAAEAGKNVTAVIELKARFDEETNLNVARKLLKRAGASVVYGFIDFKTHAKVSLVVRREPQGCAPTRTTAPATITRSTRASIPTSRSSPAIQHSAATPTACSISSPAMRALRHLKKSRCRRSTSKATLLQADPRRDRSCQSAGRDGAIWAKLNSLVHPEIIDALYRASNAKV